MTRQTQGLLLAFLGAVLVRLAISDTYLRYVTEWMKWPILVSGVLLIGLSLGPVLRTRDPDRHEHGVPWVTWLLVVPGLVTFVISPPQLGSYLAERRAGEAVEAARPASVTDLDADSGPVPLAVTEFTWRAEAQPGSLADVPVTLTGFASWGDDGAWYVTRLTLGCCAADAVAYQVRVENADRPDRDQWVAVTGVHVPGTGGGEVPAVEATEVSEVPEPDQTYE